MISWAHHWLFEDFWVLVWPNAGAMPLCAVVTFIGVWLLRDRIGRRAAAFAHRHWTAHVQREHEKARRT